MLTFIPNRYHSPKWQARITDSQKQFQFSDGLVVTSLWELKKTLTEIPDNILIDHIKPDNNHIANWIEFVIQDTELASIIKQQTNRWGIIVNLERQMMRTLNLPPYVAKRWLSYTPNAFTFQSGQNVNSIADLKNTLEAVSDQVVEFHLQRTPNDITRWLLDIIGDYILAEYIEDSPNRQQMFNCVSDHMQMLEDAINS